MNDAPVAAPVLQFLGATGTVTGSRFLLETPRARVLVDCGMFQGIKALRLRNWEPFPIEPARLDAVVLTHAHLDHAGYLPALVRHGFRGPVFATRRTVELCGIVLPDSGRLHEEDAAYANRKGYSKHRPALPLYTEEDAERALERLRVVAFDVPEEVADGVQARFRPAGHILGSATVVLDVDGPAPRRLVVSGDLGRPQHPLLQAPEAPPPCDALLVESTYGDRRHDESGALESLARVIRRCAERGGVVVIPAFAVDRTEVVLYRLKQLMASGRAPSLPVYADSPMALAALRVYRNAVADGDEDLRPELRGTLDPFDPGDLIECRDASASRAINEVRGPAIILSASGMATGGRVLHHLARRLPESRNAVALVGYQAAETRGRRLQEGVGAVKMLGRYVPVRADIVDCTTLSVHADRDELLDWMARMAEPPQTTYVVHGEPDQSESLRAAIETKLDRTAVVPRHLERVRVDARPR